MPTDEHSPGRTRHSIADHVVHIEYEGRLSLADLIGAREDFLVDPDFRPGMWFLVDVREASMLDLSEEELRQAGAHGAAMAADWGRHRTAIVVATDVDYGVSRMFSLLGERPGLELEVFREFDAATRWLGQASPG